MTSGRGVVSDGAGGFSIRDIEVGEPGPGEVLVRIEASGVCHTDTDLLGVPIPLVLGHEGAGVVEAIGDAVRGVAVGDRVVLNWANPCGSCFQCVAGNRHLCENGSQLTGGLRGHAHLDGTTVDGTPIVRAFNLGTMSTHTLVQQGAVTKVPDAVGFAAAAITGCGVMTGVGSALNAAKVAPGSSCVVLGCGGVGLNVIQGCRIAGATTIIAVDPVANRRDLAVQFGATEALDPGPDDPTLEATAKEVRARTGGRGADYAFEATAVPSLAAAPLRMIRHGGTAIAVSGVEQEVTVDMRLFEWDKTYLNPLYGQCKPERDFPRLFDLHARGLLLLDELVTRTYPLDDVQAAFDDMKAGRNAKGVLVLG
jgi:S-(hydroxymethyl)glutathione dehydrogenase/alcohol dehydrogenase